MMADQLVLISDVLSSKTWRDEILPAFVSFLKDCDSEVRTIAAERTSEVTKRLVNAAKDTSDVDDVVETVVQYATYAHIQAGTPIGEWHIVSKG